MKIMKTIHGFASIIVVSIVFIGLLVTFAPLPYYVGSNELVCLSLDCPQQGLNWGPSLYQRMSHKSKNVVDDVETPREEMENQYQTTVFNWQTYINEDHGFTFKYPKDYTVQKADQPFYDLETPLYLLTASKSNYSEVGASLYSNIGLSYSTDITNCLTFDHYILQEPIGEKVIEDTSFTYAKKSSVATGNHYESTLYRTVHNNTCYEMSMTIHETSDWNDVDYDKLNDLKVQLKTEFDRILSTFEFINQ